ncbi:hypothetical protein [Sphingosinicella terrae]|uniref:hypothetical protein n=1 Tax=Sphingosinicella terrae TaxID=2172047 RepID=UPI000E0DF145|nr:hypothetical protein [Sphingosinicella terrae]
MTINLSNSLAGLSLLTGGNAFAGMSFGISFETRAVRLAKAQFTTAEVTPPWKSDAAAPLVSAIKRMATLIDKPDSGGGLPADIQTSFIAYKALDRLRLLAESAVKTTTPAAERLTLQTHFAKGLADLEKFLGSAPADKVNLAFSQPTRRAESVPVTVADPYKTVTAGVVAERSAPLPGMTGSEVFSLTLSKNGSSEIVTVDLAQTPQPPTLDSVADAFNAAIAAIPMRNPDGTLALDADGNVQPKWTAEFVPDKSTGRWGLSLDMPTGEISVDQVGAGDALIVASGHTALDAPTAARISRIDDPAGTLERRTVATIAAVDRLATERAEMLAPADAEARTMFAATDARAVVTDAQGYSYLVGTTAGDLGSNRSDGNEDLFLTKLDGEGRVVWQRTLGAAGESRGAAISIAANGDVVVAGTVTGAFDGTNSDGDMLVARFDASGDEKFATLVRAAGQDSAQAVAVGADGSIFVGGRSATGGGDAFIARLDSSGRVTERRTIDSGGVDGVKALAVDGGGNLLALTGEDGNARLRRIDPAALATDLATLDLGAADARALAIAADGSVAVVGATTGPLAGSQVNSTSGGRDGFVARIDSALAGASITYVGGASDDQLDSAAFLDGSLYVGGRTSGDLAGGRSGITDGFVTRVDAATGAIQSTMQFGQTTQRTEPVHVAVAKGANNALGALGLSRGTINPVDSVMLVAQTSLRAGDEFSIRVDGGAARKVVIAADETLATLSAKLRRLTGTAITVTTPIVDDGKALRIDAKPGHEIELIAGGSGRDALGKIGLAPARLVAAAPLGDKAPTVRPGGNFALGLSDALDLGTAAGAALALDRVKSALSMTQTAFRSLYWDSSKEALVNGAGRRGGTVSPYMQAQAARYQDALNRLGGGTTTTSFGF